MHIKSFFLAGAAGVSVLHGTLLLGGEAPTARRAPISIQQTASLLRTLRSAREQAVNAPELRAAWEKLIQCGPEVLPRVLEAMDTPDTVAANWLHTAFDRIAEPALKAGGGEPRGVTPRVNKIDTNALLRFARDAKKQGRTRRLALETVERIIPGTRDRLLRGWSSDLEFGYDAIDFQLAELARTKDLPKEKALAAYGALMAATTDISQAQGVAAKLKALGAKVSLAETFGFPREWYFLGPFEGGGRKSFSTVYPPETKVDLKAEYAGKDGKAIRWKRASLPEAPGGRYPVHIDLRQLLAPADDAAGFAYTVLQMPAEREVEFRVAADDNLSVWLNGERLFAFEEWTNGMRLDRHRFRARLKKGANSVLVKICQGKGDANMPDTTWEFVLRVCDPLGRGVPFQNILP